MELTTANRPPPSAPYTEGSLARLLSESAYYGQFLYQLLRSVMQMGKWNSLSENGRAEEIGASELGQRRRVPDAAKPKEGHALPDEEGREARGGLIWKIGIRELRFHLPLMIRIPKSNIQILK